MSRDYWIAALDGCHILMSDTPDQNTASPEGADTLPDKGKEKPPDTVSNAHTRKRKKKCWLKWGKFAVEVLTLIVVFVYTTIAYHQWDDMRKATKLDQRAWLGVEDIPGAARIGEFFAAVVHIKNTGKTPAINTRWGATLDPRNTEPDVAMDCISAMNKTHRGVVAPGGMLSIPAKAEPWGRLNKDSLQTLGNKLIYIHGCVLYDDIFAEHSHWLTFCAHWRNDITAFENCEKGNGTGDGSGPK
jgi:hypothetical protein